jgi:hypothetical protein
MTWRAPQSGLCDDVAMRIDFENQFLTHRPGDLDVRWIHGSPSAKHNRDPEIQVHHYDDHTVILRQNMAVHYEAPFLYLLLGTDQALLVDSGATLQPEFFPLRATVERLLSGWLARHPRDHYELLVAHSHSHDDHTAGDGQFADRPGTTVVGADLAAVTGFFGLPDWPEGTAQLDLGGRVVDVIPSPGHDEPAVTYYDRATGLLLTGGHGLPGAAVCGGAGLGGVCGHAGPAAGLRGGPSGRPPARWAHRDDPSARRRLRDPHHLPAGGATA